MLGKFLRIKRLGLFLSALCVTSMISSPISLERSTTTRPENGKMKLSLTRILRTNDRTLGLLTLPDGRVLRTLEPPLRVGKPRSIPSGIYVVGVFRHQSSSLVRLRLYAVVGFSNVLIEVGNFPRDTRGCILVGLEHTPEGLKDSQKAFDVLMEAVGASNEFLLVIQDVPQANSTPRSPVLNGIYPPLRFPPIRL